MSNNPAFTPETSTNQIYRNQDTDRCLTDDLDAIESNIATMQTGKADATHTHTAADVGAAAASHTHTADSIGAAPADHTHNYAAASHTHGQSDVTGLSAALAAKADLVGGKVPASQLPSYIDDVLEYSAKSAFPATGESGKIYVATDNNKAYRWGGTAYVEISQGVTLGETSATAYRGDRGKIAYDHSQNGTVHVTAAQKTAWDAKAAGNHTHSYNDLSNKPTIPTIPASLPANGGNADTVDGKHASAFAVASHTHTAASIGAAAASHTHNYAPTGHTHPLADIINLLAVLPTKENGDVTLSLSGKDVLATIKAADMGMKTYYAPANTTNSPRASHSWRFITHKTGPLYGWVLGFSNYGSVVTNYLDNGTWRGWHTIFDVDPEPLWSGAAYMQHTDAEPQTVTPTKSLSNCQHGWLLLWSDYDPGQGVGSNSDFVTTMIPKRAYTGQKWAGGAFYCDVPCYSGSNEDDPSTEKRIIKILKIYDTKIEGHPLNKKGGRDDVVLRAVYEF